MKIYYNKLNKCEIVNLANEIITSLVEDLYIKSITNENNLVATQQWRDTMRKDHDKMLTRLLLKNEEVK